MNILSVFTKPTDNERVFHVYWANGMRRQGVLRVTVPFDDGIELRVVAELCALHCLLVRRAIFGRDRAGVGKGRKDELGQLEAAGSQLRVNVSIGKVRKLLMGRSSEADQYYSFVRWFQVRFKGAKLQTEGGDWIRPRASQHMTEMLAERALDDIQVHPYLGELAISMHSVKRFAERGTQHEPHVAWQNMRQILIGCRHIVEESEAATRHAQDKYGIGTVLLFDAEYGWTFRIARGDGHRRIPTVVTCYPRLRSRVAAQLRPIEPVRSDRSVKRELTEGLCLAS